jgi:hypothetical protein
MNNEKKKQKWIELQMSCLYSTYTHVHRMITRTLRKTLFHCDALNCIELNCIVMWCDMIWYVMLDHVESNNMFARKVKLPTHHKTDKGSVLSSRIIYNIKYNSLNIDKINQ